MTGNDAAYQVVGWLAAGALGLITGSFLNAVIHRLHRVEFAPTGSTLIYPLKPATYVQYFTRPALRSRLLQFLFFMLSFSMFISGFALFAERFSREHATPGSSGPAACFANRNVSARGRCISPPQP